MGAACEGSPLLLYHDYMNCPDELDFNLNNQGKK